MSDHVKRDFAQVLKDFEGNELRLHAACDSATMQVVIGILSKNLQPDVFEKVAKALNDGVSKPLTLSRVCTMSLGSGFDDERNLDGDERIKRFKLGMRLKEGMVKLSPSERDTIKKVVLKRFPESMVSPQACLLLEGESLQPEEPADEAAE